MVAGLKRACTTLESGVKLFDLHLTSVVVLNVHSQALCFVNCACLSSAFGDSQTSCTESTPTLSTEMKRLCLSMNCVGCLQAQAEAVVNTQVQLATVGIPRTSKMAMTSCAQATRLTPANQARPAKVTKRVTFAATPPNKAATADVATDVTRAQQGALCSCSAMWCAAME